MRTRAFFPLNQRGYSGLSGRLGSRSRSVRGGRLRSRGLFRSRSRCFLRSGRHGAAGHHAMGTVAVGTHAMAAARLSLMLHAAGGLHASLITTLKTGLKALFKPLHKRGKLRTASLAGALPPRSLHSTCGPNLHHLAGRLPLAGGRHRRATLRSLGEDREGSHSGGNKNIFHNRMK